MLAVTLLVACSEEQQSAQEPLRAVRTIVAEQSTPVRERAFPAVLQPPEITRLAFDVGGRLSLVDLQIGQSVAKGRVLATVERTDADLRLRQSEAALSEARIAQANADSEAERQETLFRRRVVSEAARDRAVTAAEQAAARVQQAERTLDLLKESLDDTQLKAPFDGIVNSIEVEAFGSVQPGQPVVTLYPEDGGLQATILVSYDVATSLKLGQDVAVRPGDGDRTPLPARVTEIARRAPAVSSFPVVVTLLETRPDLRSGMAVEILVDMAIPQLQQGIALPMSALALQHPTDFEARPREAEIYVLEADGERGILRQRTVKLGAVISDRVFVVEGLKPGERVVTAGVPFLRDGQEVAVRAGRS